MQFVLFEGTILFYLGGASLQLLYYQMHPWPLTNPDKYLYIAFFFGISLLPMCIPFSGFGGWKNVEVLQVYEAFHPYRAGFGNQIRFGFSSISIGWEETNHCLEVYAGFWIGLCIFIAIITYFYIESEGRLMLLLGGLFLMNIPQTFDVLHAQSISKIFDEELLLSNMNQTLHEFQNNKSQFVFRETSEQKEHIWQTTEKLFQCHELFSNGNKTNGCFEQVRTDLQRDISRLSSMMMSIFLPHTCYLALISLVANLWMILKVYKKTNWKWRTVITFLLCLLFLPLVGFVRWNDPEVLEIYEAFYPYRTIINVTDFGFTYFNTNWQETVTSSILYSVTWASIIVLFLIICFLAKDLDGQFFVFSSILFFGICLPFIVSNCFSLHHATMMKESLNNETIKLNTNKSFQDEWIIDAEIWNKTKKYFQLSRFARKQQFK